MTLSEALKALELPEVASLAEAKATYRDLLQVWHPDKLGNAPERIRERANQKVKALNQAWDVVCRELPLCVSQASPKKSSPSSQSGFILSVGESHKITNPSVIDIEASLLRLDVSEPYPYLILTSAYDDGTYIQVYGDKDTDFELEYQELNIRHHYLATDDATLDQVFLVMTLYLQGRSAWRNLFGWEKMDLQ